MDQFVRRPEAYRRSIDVIPTYIRDMATFLHKTTGEPLEKCLDFVQKDLSPKGAHPLTIPDAVVLERQSNGDRKKITMPLNEYFNAAVREEGPLSPSLTTYLSSEVHESFLGRYISNNLTKRSDAKKKMLLATMERNVLAAAIYDGLQSSFKIKNNSLSGAHVSAFTVLHNKSAHSTLTSTCRAAASCGNANNEKFLCGNRHYWSPDVVKANLISIINLTDMNALATVVNKYGIRAPTIDETMDCITYSSNLYWRNDDEVRLIRMTVANLSDLERSAFAYVGDMHHLAKHNDALVREFIGKLSMKATEPCDEPKVWIKRMDGDMKAFISLLCASELDGGTVDKLEEKDPRAYGIVAGTAKQVMETLTAFEDLIRALWVTDNMPASIAAIPTIMRRSAITSDTDSTIFTVQNWTQWYVGQLDFTEKSNAVAATVVYLASQLIRHILAIMSTNMGVAKKHLFMLQMKNEYMFPIFTLTSRAKHYYAYISAREGNVYHEYESEIKGVALRNSTVPPKIMKKAKELMLGCMDEIIKGNKLSYREILAQVASVEKGIFDSLSSGSYELMSRASIKSPESYKDPNASNYIHYELWQEVFAAKYGDVEPPPYSAVKVSIGANNPTKIKTWLTSMEDPAIAAKLQAWLDKRNRKSIEMLLLPEAVLQVTGVPKEIICGMNKRELVSGLMDSFYLILESLGIYLRNRHITRLASDTNWTENA